MKPEKIFLLAGIVFLLAGIVLFMSGCSQFGCYYGDCQQIATASNQAAIAAENIAATDADLAESLRSVAEYYADLYDNSQPFCGLYASAAYRDILQRSVATSGEIATRAEAGKLSRLEMQSALKKYAAHLNQLQNASLGAK